ncbi:Hpt domain-containing protein [Flavitalea flava]
MQQLDPPKFIFSARLNADFLDELFEGDTIYAETVFEDFLRDLPDYWKSVEIAHKNGNLSELGTTIHKCKTLFGYVGFTDIQEFCQEFENNCATASLEMLNKDYKLLSQRKEEARKIIEQEYNRLKSFNAANG